MKKRTQEFSIKDLLDLFIPKIWIILLCSVILGVLLGSYALSKPKTYTSESDIMVSKANSTSINVSDIELSARIIDNFELIIMSRDFLEHVIDEINNHVDYSDKEWNLTASQLRSAISVTQNGETSTFNISVTTTNYQISYAVASILTEQIQSYIIPKVLPPSFGVVTTSVINMARENKVANSDNLISHILIGFVAGMLLSMICIYVLHILDVVIHDRKKIEECFDIPVLGVIPRYNVDTKAIEEGKNV